MNKLEIGKRYTWNEVKETYPGMWVRMSDCNLTIGSGIIDGTLVGVYTDDESIDAEIKMLDEGAKDMFCRTTDGMGIGVIDCLNAELGVRDEP